MPRTIAAGDLPDYGGDPAKGRHLFYASGCASCHAAPGAKGDDKLKLSGGLGLESPFGTFYASNISPDPTHGIGGWTAEQFATALTAGVAPDGSFYYPVFPYASYTRMQDQDIADLWAYLQTVPAVSNRARVAQPLAAMEINWSSP